MINVTIRGKNGQTFDVPGEPTDVEGLYVTPVIHMRSFSYAGGFNLTHAPSGKGLLGSLSYRDPAIAHDLAERLHPIASDWTDLPHHRDDWPTDLREAVRAVLLAHYTEVISSGVEFVSRAERDAEAEAAADWDPDWPEFADS